MRGIDQDRLLLPIDCWSVCRTRAQRYFRSDHLGSTVLETGTSGAMTADQQYYAYGRQRDTGPVVTDHKFTGQKLDATGLQYFNTRYYDPEIGQFISPDTLVPDPSNLLDYNRYMYTRGNPMRYTDPSGHQSCMAMAPAIPLVLGCQAGELAMRYGPTIMQLAVQWADKLPAVDWLFSNTAEQGANSAGQQNAGNSSTGDPFDPKDPWKSFRNRGMGEQSVKDVQKATQNGVDPAKMFQQYNDLLNKGVDMTGHALEQAQLRNIPTQKIADTFTGAARNTQYFWDGSRVAQWSPHTNVAVIVEKATRQVVTVFERTSPQRDWQSMSAFEVMKWLDK